MKQKMSITIEEKTVAEIEEKVKVGLFRNKSHFIEYACSQLLEEEKK